MPLDSNHENHGSGFGQHQFNDETKIWGIVSSCGLAIGKHAKTPIAPMLPASFGVKTPKEICLAMIR